LEAKKDAAAAQTANATPAAASAPEVAAKPATGPKSVRVSISYDEAGRVTQTSVVGSSPGAEAYASTAVRVARGRRFPAGKAGSTVVTIPIN
jgi:TonB family protein